MLTQKQKAILEELPIIGRITLWLGIPVFVGWKAIGFPFSPWLVAGLVIFGDLVYQFFKRNAKADSSRNWYVWEPFEWRFGNLWFQTLAGVLYLQLAMLPLVQYLVFNKNMPEWTETPGLIPVWAVFVSLAHPLWVMFETSFHEKWCSDNFKDKDDLKEQQRLFTNNTKVAENFWKAVVATYTVGGVMSFSSDMKKATAATSNTETSETARAMVRTADEAKGAANAAKTAAEAAASAAMAAKTAAEAAAAAASAAKTAAEATATAQEAAKKTGS